MIVQDAVPEPVAEVLDVVPENVPTSVPDATALPRLFVMLVRSVLRSAKIWMRLPATGAERDVMVVLVWLPMEAMLLTNPAHCVAVTVPAAETVARADSPYPLSPDPVDQISFTFAPDVVEANPL